MRCPVGAGHDGCVGAGMDGRGGLLRRLPLAADGGDDRAFFLEGVEGFVDEFAVGIEGFGDVTGGDGFAGFAHGFQDLVFHRGQIVIRAYEDTIFLCISQYCIRRKSPRRERNGVSIHVAEGLGAKVPDLLPRHE